MTRVLGTIWILAGCGATDPEPTDGGSDLTGSPTAETADSGDTPEPKPVEVSGLAWETHGTYIGPFIVSWTQSIAGTVYVEYQVDGGWQRTPDVEGTAGANQATVVGVPAGQPAAWRVTVADGSSPVDGETMMSDDRTPANFPTVDVVTSDPKLWSTSGAYVLLPLTRSFNTAWVTILDRQGRLIWGARAGRTLQAQITAAGDAIVWGDTQRRTAHRVHLDDSIQRIDVPGVYHALIELPDGTTAWDGGQFVEIAPGAAKPVRVSKDYDPGYTNGLSFDTTTGAYVLSDFTDERVVALDRTTGEFLWQAVNTARGNKSGLAFDPPESRFTNQHGIEMLANGNLLVSTEMGASVGMREYEVDTDKDVLRLVWEYDSGIKAAASFSWAHRLSNGSSLHAVRESATVYEVTADKNVAWEIDVTGVTFVGRAEAIDDLYDLVAPPVTP